MKLILDMFMHIVYLFHKFKIIINNFQDICTLLFELVQRNYVFSNYLCRIIFTIMLCGKAKLKDIEKCIFC